MNCKVCDINNLAEVNIFTKEEVNQFINNIVIGAVTVESLDAVQHLKIARKLSDSVDLGFGNPIKDVPFNLKRFELYNSFIENIYAFSAAKQYQLVREITYLADSGKAKNRDDFFKMAEDVFNKYNVTYLTTELDSAEWTARGAKDWLEFEEWNNAEG